MCKGLGAYLLRFFRKRGQLTPPVTPTCKKRGFLHIAYSKDALKHAVN